MDVIDLSADDDASSESKVASNKKVKPGFKIAKRNLMEDDEIEVNNDVDDDDDDDDDDDNDDDDDDDDEEEDGNYDDIEATVVKRSSSSNDALVRSSKRKRTSRLIKVNGFSVFKSNNYGIAGDVGLSVWDHELRTKDENDNDDDEYDPKKESWQPKKISSKPHVFSEAALARKKSLQDHNAMIKQSLEKSMFRRQEFIRQNWKLIHPFLDPSQNIPQPCSKETSKDIEKFKFPVLESQPSCLQNVDMRDYQLAGVNWLIKSYSHGNSVILGDEMGLGKTLQTIAFLGWLMYEQHVSGPHLVIVPLSVISNWMNEFRRFLPQMRVLKLHSSDPDEKERLRKEILPQLHEKYDVVITTYEMIKNPKLRYSLVSSIFWRYVVLDEGHLIRHEDCIIAETVRKLHSERCLLLTGTPLQNNLHELWSLLNFLQPDLFKSAQRFDECFNITHSTKHYINKELLMKVHSLLKPFMLRRIKLDVERTVPPKIEKKILCPLTPTQVFWYKRFLLRESTLLMQLESETAAAANNTTDNNTVVTTTEPTMNSSRWQRLRAVYMQLRKVCNHPFLFEEADNHPEYTDESIIEASGKLKVLDKLLNKLHSAGHRVVIFSQFTRVLDIIGDYLNFRGYEFCRLDGSSNRVQRQISINMFNAKNTTLFAFIMSTRAGGLGVNLQTADTVVLFDSDWNPMADLQAMARVHRIGQTKVVHVYRLVAGGTVEERIVQRAEKKLFLDQVVNRDGLKENTQLGNMVDSQIGSSQVPSETKSSEIGGKSESASGSEEEGSFNTEQLLEALRFGADVICNSASTELTDYDIDQLISRQAGLGPAAYSCDITNSATKATTTGFNTTTASTKGSSNPLLIQEGKKYSAAHFDPTEAPVDTRQFQGQTFDKYGTSRGKSFYNCSSNMTDIDQEVFKKDLAIENETKRESKQRLVTVKDDFGHEHKIFKQNLYDLQTGEQSVFERELKNNTEFAKNAKLMKRHVQIAGRDYENEDQCLRCWNPGDLVLCDRCPASFHSVCLSKEELVGRNAATWMCPHHKCSVCKRTASAAGGLLLRCSECPLAFCEDHIPPDAAINGRCLRMEQGGYKLPDQACYIHCSDGCAAYAATYESTIKTNKRLYNTGIEEETPATTTSATSTTSATTATTATTTISPTNAKAHIQGERKSPRQSPAKIAKITMSDINNDKLSFLAKPHLSTTTATSTANATATTTATSTVFVDTSVTESTSVDVVNPPQDTSLTAALTSSDSGSALVHHLLRLKLPTFLATDRCEKCNKIHQNPEHCPVWFLGGRLTHYPHIKMSLEDAKLDFLAGMLKIPSKGKKSVYTVQLRNEKSLNHVMTRCSVVNAGEVVIALMTDGLLVPADGSSSPGTQIIQLAATDEAVAQGKQLLYTRQKAEDDARMVAEQQEAAKAAALESIHNSARVVIHELIVSALKNPRLIDWSTKRQKCGWLGYYYANPYHMSTMTIHSYINLVYNGPTWNQNNGYFKSESMYVFINNVIMNMIKNGILYAYEVRQGGSELQRVPSEKIRPVSQIKNNLILALSERVSFPEFVKDKMAEDESKLRNLALLYKSLIPVKRLVVTTTSPLSTVQPSLSTSVKSTVSIWSVLASVELAFKTEINNKYSHYLNMNELLPNHSILSHIPLISEYFAVVSSEPHFGQFLRSIGVLVVNSERDMVEFRDEQLTTLYKRDYTKERIAPIVTAKGERVELDDEEIDVDDEDDDDYNGNNASMGSDGFVA